MKKGWILLACVVMLTASGCSAGSWNIFAPSSSETPSSSEPFRQYPEEFRDRWCYRRLSARLQSAYSALYTAVRDCSEDETITIADSKTGEERDYIGLQVTLPESLESQEEIQRLYTAFTWDNPQFFYIGNTYSFEGYQMGENNYYNTISLVLTMNQAERTAAAGRLEQTVTEILDQRPAAADAFETELYLHDTLTARCSYDQNTAECPTPAERYPNAFTSYGALVEGRAVCEGYSRAMQLLMHRVGMECTLVSGFSTEGEAHMWNLVMIDSRCYHLDATWNDADDLPRHTFFNLTTEDILLSHTIDKENIGINTCTSEEANYYRRKGLYLDTYDPAEIGKAVAARIRARDAAVDLRFPLKKFPNAQLLFSSHRRLSGYVNPLLKSEGLSLWNYTCQVNDVYGTVTIYRQN